MRPECAFFGMVTTSVCCDGTTNVALTPPTVTHFGPPRLTPWTVTFVPAAPLIGAKLEMCVVPAVTGWPPGRIVNALPEEAVPSPVVTVIFPPPAGVPAGTYAMILVPVASGTWTLLAGWPLNDTIGMARSWLSQEPVIVTLVPTLPWLGPNDAIRGAFVDRASAEPARRQAVPTRSATIDTNVICFRISITPFVRFLAIRPTRVSKRR